MKRKIYFPVLDKIQQDIIKMYCITFGYDYIYSISAQKALIVDETGKAWFIQIKDSEIFMTKGTISRCISHNAYRKAINYETANLQIVADKHNVEINIVIDTVMQYGVNKVADTKFIDELFTRIEEEIDIEEQAEANMMQDDYINDERLIANVV